MILSFQANSCLFQPNNAKPPSEHITESHLKKYIVFIVWEVQLSGKKIDGGTKLLKGYETRTGKHFAYITRSPHFENTKQIFNRGGDTIVE